jgi:hypothetical protein
MPKLHKITSQGNQVAFSFREWDGIDHPDYTTIVMSLAEAEATLGYFTAAIAAAKREDVLKQERERKELLRQEQQLMQQLQSIQDRLGGFSPLKDSAEDRPETMPTAASFIRARSPGSSSLEPRHTRRPADSEERHMITALLLSLLSALIVLYVVERFGNERRIRKATRQIHIALQYIADRRDGKASQFAWLFLTGNVLHMAHSFPDFESYRQRMETAEDEAEDAGA